MASMNDLSKLLQENPAVREDFLKTIVGFLQRHNIQVNPDEIKGFELNDDARGYLGSLSPTGGTSLGTFPTGGIQPLRSPGSVSIIWSTEGNSRSSTFWV